VFEGVPQAEVAMSEIENGLDIICQGKKTGFLKYLQKYFNLINICRYCI